MILDEAQTVARTATWTALCAALDAYREAVAVMRRAAWSQPATSVEYQRLAVHAQAALAQVQCCWRLHFGEARPAWPVDW